MTPDQQAAYIQAIADAGITPQQLAGFLSRAQLQLERTALDSAINNLETERAKTMAAIDARRNQLIAARDAKQAEIDKL